MNSWIIILSLMIATSGKAEPLSAEAFDQLTRGKTFYYGDGLSSYGAEQYLSGRRVIWSWLDGACQFGRWYETDRAAICFVYELETEPQCWRFELQDGRIAAEYLNEPGHSQLYELNQDNNALICEGPKVGV